MSGPDRSCIRSAPTGPTTTSPMLPSANTLSFIEVPRFDADTFRRTLGRFATGVTLVTAADASGPIGLLVNAFTSVSLEPPLIAICPSRHSFTWTRMRRGKRFGVNVLGAEHANYVR